MEEENEEIWTTRFLFFSKKKFISCSAKLNWKTNQISINCIWCLCEWLFITSSIDSTDLLVRSVDAELFANPAASRTLQLSSQRLTRAWNVCTRESLNISLQSLAPPESFLMCLNFNLWIPTSEALATVSAISQCCCCFCARYEIYLIASSWARGGAREEKSHSHDEKNKNNKSNFSVIVCICSLLVEAALLISKYCPRKKREIWAFLIVVVASSTSGRGPHDEDLIIFHNVCASFTLLWLIILLFHPFITGGLFSPLPSDNGDRQTASDPQEIAFRYAVDKINADNKILPRSKLQAEIERIMPQDSFHASKRVCHLMKTGVAAIFGPQSPHTASHVQSICDTMEVSFCSFEFKMWNNSTCSNFASRTDVPITMSVCRPFYRSLIMDHLSSVYLFYPSMFLSFTRMFSLVLCSRFGSWNGPWKLKRAVQAIVDAQQPCENLPTRKYRRSTWTRVFYGRSSMLFITFQENYRKIFLSSSLLFILCVNSRL